MRARRCDNCAAWDGDTGRCHRYAPRPSTQNELMDKDIDDDLWTKDCTNWPVTDSADWCLDWVPFVRKTA